MEWPPRFTVHFNQIKGKWRLYLKVEEMQQFFKNVIEVVGICQAEKKNWKKKVLKKKCNNEIDKNRCIPNTSEDIEWDRSVAIDRLCWIFDCTPRCKPICWRPLLLWDCWPRTEAYMVAEAFEVGNNVSRELSSSCNFSLRLSRLWSKINWTFSPKCT